MKVLNELNLTKQLVYSKLVSIYCESSEERETLKKVLTAVEVNFKDGPGNELWVVLDYTN